MGRPRTTGGSHNKKASTYHSARKSSGLQLSKNQVTMFNYLRKENVATESGPSVVPVTEGHDSDTDTFETQLEDETDNNDINEQTGSHTGNTVTPQNLDGRRRWIFTQRIGRWESLYESVYYSNKDDGWYCRICKEYGDDNSEYWKTRAVKTGEHPQRTFDMHINSKKHKTALKRKSDIKQMFRRGSIYRQVSCPSGSVSKRNRNRKVLKKFLKTTYFVTRKKWAVKENFADVIDFLRELGDTDIDVHMKEASSRANYTSTTSVEDYLTTLSDYIENKLKQKLVIAGDFSLLADETTDMADRSEMSIFVRFVDSDSKQVEEKFLTLVQLESKKGAKDLVEKIKSVMVEKGIDISKMRFSGLDGTNTMSGEKSGLQRRLRHLAPHAKYVNCRNHRLALVFVHLIREHKLLRDVDNLLLAVWKMMKYSSVKSGVFNEAQNSDGQPNLKLLKAAPTRWLSHGEACQRLVSRYENLVNALDSLIEDNAEPEVIGVRSQLLEPDIILFLLLLSDILIYVNRFCKFLQTQSLVYSVIPSKFEKLKTAITDLKTEDGFLFKQHASDFLHLSKERMSLARRLRHSRLFARSGVDVPSTDDIEHKIQTFRTDVKVPFLNAVISELEAAMNMDDKVFQAFDVFNVRQLLDVGERNENIKLLQDFYGSPCSSTFEDETNTAEPIAKPLVDMYTVDLFFQDFNDAVTKAENRRNRDLFQLVQNRTLKDCDIDSYKESHPILPADIYSDLCETNYEYPEIMRLFKLSLLIPPTTSNVERGFSVLNLLHTKQRNRLTPSSLEKLLRIILVGPQMSEMSNEVWEDLINKYKDLKQRRIEL